MPGSDTNPWGTRRALADRPLHGLRPDRDGPTGLAEQPPAQAVDLLLADRHLRHAGAAVPLDLLLGHPGQGGAQPPAHRIGDPHLRSNAT